MAFLYGSDEIAQTEFVLFPRTYEQVQIHKGDVIHVLGRVEKRFDKYQIVARRIQVLYHSEE